MRRSARRFYGAPVAAIGGGFNPISALWPLGTEAGMWLDPSDAATGWQASDGTTAGAVNSPIGLRLDKRLGSAGANVLTNGDFSSGTTGWTSSGTTTFTAPGGVANVAVNGGTAQTYQTYATVVGKWYYLSGTIKTSPTNGGFAAIRKGDNAVFGVNAVDAVTISGATAVDTTSGKFFQATAATTYIGMQCNVGDANFDSLATQLWDGNHVLQATAPARPTWKLNGAIYSDLGDGVDDGYSAPSGITLINGMDCFIAIKRNAAAQHVVCSQAPSDGAKFFGTMISGSAALAVSGGGSAWSNYVNGTIVGGVNTTTAGQLYTAVGTGSYVVLEVRDLDLSLWNQFTVGLYASFMLNADIGGVILCPAQSAANRNSIRTYLGSKVGLSL